MPGPRQFSPVSPFPHRFTPMARPIEVIRSDPRRAISLLLWLLMGFILPLSLFALIWAVRLVMAVAERLS